MKKITVLILIFLSVLCLGGLSTRASTVIEGPTIIHKGRNTVLPISDILDMYTSELGPVSVSIDEYTGNGNLIGEYSIEVYATDGATIHSKMVTIVVVNSLPSKIKAIGNHSDIYTNTSKALTLKEDILPALQITEFVLVTQTTVGYILNNQYTANYETPGTYFYQFRLLDASGYDMTFDINIIVKDSGSIPDPDIVYTPPRHWTQGFINGIVTIFYWLIFLVPVFFIFKAIFKAKKAVSSK